MTTDAPSSPSPRAVHVVACAAVVLVTIAALYPVLGHDYVEWDDPHTVFANPDFNPPRPAAFTRHWARPEHGLYVPMVYTVWYPVALLARQTGEAGALDPRVFHAANLAAHVACALAVYALLHVLVRRPLPAAVGAILFAVHPVQVESVAWISGLKDVLCGLFSAVALWLYVRHATIDPGDSARARQRLACYLLATAALAAALLSKPVAVVVPVMAFALDRGLLRRPLATVAATLIPWVLLAAPVMLLTRLAQPVSLIPEVYAIAPPRVRPIVAGDALAFYARHVVWPARLALDYGRSPDVIAARPWAWLAWLVPLGVFGGLWLLRRRARPLVVGVIVFFVGLIPVLGLVPFGAQLYSSVADHYLYLPMIGIALAAAWLASLVRPRVALAVAAPLLLALAARSWFQAGHWRDTNALFAHNVRVNPRSWTSHINLAAAALARNDGSAAEHHARAAVALRPNDGLIHKNLGIALGQQGRFDEAIDSLQRAATMVPNDPSTRFLLAEALVRVGRPDDAAAQYRAALHLDPDYLAARRALAALTAAPRGAAAPTSSPGRD